METYRQEHISMYIKILSRYKLIVTKRRVIAAIIGIWAFSLGILLATVRYRNDICVDASICLVSNELEYVVHSVVSAFFVPAAVTLILYYKIFTIAKRREEGLRKGLIMLTMNENFFSACLTEPMRVHCGRDNMQQQEKVIQMHKKVAKTLGVVVLSFLICWVPFFATYLLSKSFFGINQGTNVNLSLIHSNVLKLINFQIIIANAFIT